MKNVFFVTQDQFDIARAMEKKLLDLPEDSGILFVGISVQENQDKRRDTVQYKIVIGCSRARDPDLMDALARQYLKEFVKDDQQLVVHAFRGVGRISATDN